MKRRIQKLLILLIAAALMACCTPGCGTVTPAPTPTGTPDSTPTPATTPSPTPDDTAVPPATAEPVVTPEPAPSQSPTLTDEERMAEIEAFLNEPENAGFRGSLYNDIGDILLHDVLPLITDSSIPVETVLQALEEAGYSDISNVAYIGSDALDSLLREKTSYGLADKSWNLTSGYSTETLYLPDLDLYCVPTSSYPAGYQLVTCEYMTAESDLYTVTCQAVDRPQLVVYDSPTHTALVNRLFITLRALGNGRYQFVSVSLFGKETPENEELLLSEMDVFLNRTPQNYFLGAAYSNISDIPLHIALRYYCDHSVPYEDAQRIFLAAGYEQFTDISYFNSKSLDEILRRMTGYGLYDIQWNNSIHYVEEADLYFKQHGDTAFTPVTCTSVEIKGDLYTVIYHNSFAENSSFWYLDEAGNNCRADQMVVTLRKAENGEYHFVSNHPVLTDEERMAEIEAFLNEKSSNYLLNKIFTDVRSLSLLSFFAGYCDDSILYSEAKALYNDLQGYTYRYDVNYITGDKLKDRIHSLTGLSLSDYHTGSVMYIPERDMYITESINPRYHPVICKSITSDGDLYTVIYRSADFGISVVSGDLYEFRAMSVTLRSLGSGKYEFVSNQPHFFPEDEHAKKLYEIGVFLNTMPYNGMLHLQYESIDDIRICELLYQCQDETLSYEDAIAACKAADVAIESPITYMRGTELDKLLKSITGFGLSDKDWDFHGVRYLTDADLYFVMHSDTNYYPVSCHSHIIDGDIHIVTYDTPSSTSLSKDYTVTLRDLGNGEYQFISNISVPEQLNYDAFLLSEISDFINFYENTGFRLSDESFMLSQVIPYIKDSSIPQDTVISKLNAAGYSITKDVSCISREALDKFLIKKTGRALGSFNLEHQDGLIYLPDMDIYCVQTDHSTPPPQPAVSCISCVRDGNYVTAHCRISKSDKHYEYFHFRNYQGKVIETDDLYITLKYSVEEGQYRFVSCSSTANDYPHAPALIE